MLKISVITAVYNRVGTIGNALDSVQQQTWPEIEHVVIDGASDDGTLGILEAHRDQLAALVSEPDKGIYDALNKGIALVSGDVVGLMHSDDFYADNRVLERVATAFVDPTVDGVYGDLDYVTKDDSSIIMRRWCSGEYHSTRLPWGWMPPHPALFWRRSVVGKLGGYDATLRISADYDLILRYLWLGGLALDYIPEVLVKMRVGGKSNCSLSHMVRKSYEDYLALRRNNVGGFGALAMKNIRKIPQFLYSRR